MFEDVLKALQNGLNRIITGSSEVLDISGSAFLSEIENM